MDRDSAGFWERAAKGELAVQRCLTCGRRRFPARAFCAACRTEDWEWEAIEPRGRVESWIISHRPFEQGVVVMIRLEAGIAYGNWAHEREPVAGEPVEAVFTGGLVNWRPVNSGR
ncbi:Zn-ribbon domain-containing OB-fold protein [Nonomuraea sp. NPDC050556]|uniref:Zn-ribbon domain-containing OB-fold protein n=1 Tax=Nonomuraea sp. NPDC050556 TaxID=3364369 RepID=UPI0037AD14EE